MTYQVAIEYLKPLLFTTIFVQRQGPARVVSFWLSSIHYYHNKNCSTIWSSQQARSYVHGGIVFYLILHHPQMWTSTLLKLTKSHQRLSKTEAQFDDLNKQEAMFMVELFFYLILHHPQMWTPTLLKLTKSHHRLSKTEAQFDDLNKQEAMFMVELFFI